MVSILMLRLFIGGQKKVTILFIFLRVLRRKILKLCGVKKRSRVCTIKIHTVKKK